MENSEPSDFLLVQYPGVVKNSQKVIEKLGGMEKIRKSYFHNQSVDLNFDSENPYHRPICSNVDSTASNNDRFYLVVKARRKKNPKTPEDSKIDSQIVGTVKKIHEFRSLFDFQYLPIQKTSDNPEVYENLLPKLFPHDIPSALSWWDQPVTGKDQVPRFLPPYVFSRFNFPSTYVLMRDIQHTNEAILEKTKDPKTLGHTMRQTRTGLSICVNSDDIFAESPSDDAVFDANERYKGDKGHERLNELFQMRPLWCKNAIQSKTGLDTSTLKVLLQKYGFYIMNGPWGRLWCRFGYDPRKEPTAKRYQSVSVQIRHPRIPEKMRRLQGQQSLNDEVKEPQNTNQDNSWVFVAHQLPAVRQCWYSLCDIHLPIVEQYLRMAPPPVCDPTNGWLPPDAVEIIRNEVKENVNNKLKEMDELEENIIKDDEIINNSDSSDDNDNMDY